MLWGALVHVLRVVSDKVTTKLVIELHKLHLTTSVILWVSCFSQKSGKHRKCHPHIQKHEVADCGMLDKNIPRFAYY